jgi:hypothetical protein
MHNNGINLWNKWISNQNHLTLPIFREHLLNQKYLIF